MKRTETLYSWDWSYNEPSKRTTSLVILSDDPRRPVIERWSNDGTHESTLALIHKAQELIKELRNADDQSYPQN